jgi:hypothetical protein
MRSRPHRSERPNDRPSSAPVGATPIGRRLPEGVAGGCLHLGRRPGVDPSGAVPHTTAIDSTWEPTGNLPGPPQALLANGDTVYAAAEENGATGIYQSTDDGVTWQTRYRDDQQWL